MVIEESSLKFKFPEETRAIKFDDTEFYRREFNKLPQGKGVDIIADAPDLIQLIEIKNCKAHEIENMWRTSTNNSKLSSAPHTLDISDRDSLDIEVAKKVSSTISCLYGAWTKSERDAKAQKLIPFWEGINTLRISRDRKQVVVLLFLEGDFGVNTSQSRSKRMIMQRIQESLSQKLEWLNCRVVVVDSDTYKKRYFEVEYTL